MNKTRVFAVVLSLTLLLSVIGMISCKGKEKEPVKLATPTVVLDGAYAVWEENPLAERFEVSVDGVLSYMENSFTRKKLEDGQSIKIRAIGDGVEYLNSDWSNSVIYSSTNTEPTPDPDPEPVSCKVTFYDEDGVTVLAAVSVKAGETAKFTAEIPEKDDIINGEETLYRIFDGWVTEPGGNTIADLTNIQSDMSVYAYYGTYDMTYTVIFLDFYGETISKVEVGKGGMATAPTEIPLIDGYKFVGWSKSFQSVTSNLVVEALYERLNLVVFYDFQNNVIKSEWVENTKNATPPIPPTVEGYTFVGWSALYTNITGDTEIKALYEVNKYTVTFRMPDGTILDEQKVEPGMPASEPHYPEYTIIKEDNKNLVKGFSDWDKSFSKIEADTVVTAVYAQEYTDSTPVIVVEYKKVVEDYQEHTVVSISVFTAKDVSLYALTMNVDFESEGNLTVTQIKLEPTSKLTNANESTYSLNNNEHTFSFAWANSKGVEFDYCDHLMNLVTSVNAGMQVNETNFKIVNTELVLYDTENGFTKVSPVVVYIVR